MGYSLGNKDIFTELPNLGLINWLVIFWLRYINKKQYPIVFYDHKGRYIRTMVTKPVKTLRNIYRLSIEKRKCAGNELFKVFGVSPIDVLYGGGGGLYHL